MIPKFDGKTASLFYFIFVFESQPTLSLNVTGYGDSTHQRNFDD